MVWLVPDMSLELPLAFPVKNPTELHVTLDYNVSSEKAIPEGKECSFLLKSICKNDKIQAISVELPPEIPCKNKHPHITLSMARGVKPVESNDMLAGTHEEIPLNIVVKGRVVHKNMRRF